MFEKVLIAEIGSVHDGSFGNAKNLIRLAKQCNVDAVKFQTHIAEAESTTLAPNPSYFKGESRIEYFNRTSFTSDQLVELKAYAEELDLIFLSSPFSLEAVDLLEEIGIVGYKIPSGEVTNIPLIEKVSETKKPILLSSGMSNWSELDSAVSICKKRCETIVMQCSSKYPCPPDKYGINVIKEMVARYETKVGYSDHSMGFSAPIMAVAAGATVIEKHFTFSRHMYGSDAKHSFEPNEMTLLADELKNAWICAGSPVDKSNNDEYKEIKNIFEKSIVASQLITKGTILRKDHLSFKKPGNGLSPSEYSNIIGKVVANDIEKDELILKSNLL